MCFCWSERQLARLSHFPLSHGVPRVDDRRVVSGIVYVISTAASLSKKRLFPVVSGEPRATEL